MELVLPVAETPLDATLVVPPQASGLVVFVHGSGSNRHSVRNRAVAAALQRVGLATLLFDLLASSEQLGANGRGLDWIALGQRLLAVMAQLPALPRDPIDPALDLAALPLGLFGSSSGAAVALAAAAAGSPPIRAVVCRGGRPDLVPACLPQVHCPTLLLVGSHDVDVLELNSWAAARLQGLHEVRVVPGAGHLFAEPGALDQVARWSQEWFLQHLLA